MMRLSALQRLRAWLHPAGLLKLRVANTAVWFRPQYDQVVREYYLYVVGLLVQAARDSRAGRVLVVGDFDPAPQSALPLMRIDFQIEHTLVKPGGRGADHAPSGVIAIREGEPARYLVRVHGHARLAKADVLIEYSRPNLVHVQSSGHYADLARRMHYIAPLLYPLDFVRTTQGRDLELVTLFGNPEEPRRKALLQGLKKVNPACQNINGRFSDIQSVYARTRILVNVRQTDHHDTLEELRVLPALLCGVIVVSEDIPLREQVPYHRFIRWAPIEAIPALVQEISASYEAHFNAIFMSAAFSACLQQLDESNRKEINQILSG